MKKVLITTVVLAVGAAVWLGVHDGSQPRTASRADNSAKVQRRTIDIVVEAIGDVNPANQVVVKPEVSGKILTVAAVAGQTKKQGDLLVSLDDTDLLTERDAAQTQIAGAQLQLEKADRDFQRNRDLFADKLVSKEAFDNARTSMDQAHNEYDKARKQLQSVEDKLKKIRILAPFAGTVLTVSVSNGQVVSGATSVSQGSELMTFADLNEMIIRGHINQADITKIKSDQTVTITVDSIPGIELEGKVILIAPIATVKNSIKGFSVDVLITRSDPRLRPGMNANLKFPVAHVVNALAVPLAAVFAEEKQKVVYVKTPTGTERRVVEVGVADVNHCEITKGLAEGDEVSLERPAQPKSS